MRVRDLGFDSQIQIESPNFDDRGFLGERVKSILENLSTELSPNQGALLFRGFKVDTQEKFQECVSQMGVNALKYIDGNSPRTDLGNSVYTSTEYPKEYSICQHSELSYSNQWPSWILLNCVQEPQEGGATPIADCSRVLQDLDPALLEELKRRGIVYVRNLSNGLGLGKSWQQTFQTDRKAEVEQILAKTRQRFQWKEGDVLSLQQEGRITVIHPRSGKEVWFNQIDQFHPSSLPSKTYESLLKIFGSSDALPQDVRFADDLSEFDPGILVEIRRSVAKNLIRFSWKAGDVLLLDNVLMSHGRDPYRGPRKVLVTLF